MWANEQADEARFFLATLESFQTGRVTPLLKEELRCKIQSRRLSEGKDELSVNLEEEDVDLKDCSLRPDEIERNKRRKEQNRKAAAKFRKKQKSQNKALQGLVVELEKRNAELKKEVDELTRERDELRVEVLDTLRKKSSHECGDNELSFQQFAISEFQAS